MISHYKGQYRIKCEYDKTKNQFTRKLDGTYEDIDCYIDCYNNVRIFYYGKSILEAYIPSKIRGHNLIKTIEEELGQPATLVATGGLAKVIMPHCKREIFVDDDLLLKGLRIIYDKNH